MAIRLVKYPDSRLRLKSLDVKNFDDDLKRLIKSMSEVMYKNNGIGIAAPQLGVHRNVFLIDISDDRTNLQVFINPVLFEFDGTQQSQEGCLSCPNVQKTVERYQSLKIDAYNIDGNQFQISAFGLLACVIQHEFDHLRGVLLVDK